MGYVYRFYVEVRTEGGWDAPGNLPRDRAGSERERRLGCFCTARRSPSGWPSLLFFETDALFPMRRGAPPDRGISPLLRRLDPTHDRQIQFQGWDITPLDPSDPFERVDLCWIPYQDLCVDAWDEFPVVVRGQIAAGSAPLFWDGERAFPRNELLAAGFTQQAIDTLEQNAGWTETPLCTGFGVERFRVEQLPSDTLVPVTWQTTLTSFMGDYATAFTQLRRYGADRDLRILCTGG